MSHKLFTKYSNLRDHNYGTIPQRYRQAEQYRPLRSIAR